MTVLNPPMWLQGRTDHSAAGMRRAVASSLLPDAASPNTGRGGVRATNAATDSLMVTALATPGNAVNIAAGQGWVAGTTYPATQGVYTVTNDGVYQLNLTPAHATLPRRDLIVIHVYDNEIDGSGLNQAVPEQIVGVANASPVAPAIPANCLLLAEWYSAAGTAARPIDLLDRRNFSGSGIVPYHGPTNRPAPFPGLIGYDMDASRWEGYTFSGWRRLLHDPDNTTGVWNQYTPTFTAGGSAVALGAGGSKAGRYKVIGKTCFYEFHIYWGAASPGSGVYAIGLPITASSLILGSPPGLAYVGNGNGNYIDALLPTPAGATTMVMWAGASTSTNQRSSMGGANWTAFTGNPQDAGAFIDATGQYEID